MELKLRDGRYPVLPGGLLGAAGGDAETLQRVQMRLTARRGAFWPDPDYGSRLYTLGRLKPSQRETAAGQFVAEALAPETDLAVERVTYTPGADGAGTVSVTVSLRGRETELIVEV